MTDKMVEDAQTYRRLTGRVGDLREGTAEVVHHGTEFVHMFMCKYPLYHPTCGASVNGKDYTKFAKHDDQVTCKRCKEKI